MVLLYTLADSSLDAEGEGEDTQAAPSAAQAGGNETSTSSTQTTDPGASEAVDPDEAGETVVPLPEGDAAAATNSDNPDPEAVAKGPTVQSGADDGHAAGEGLTVPQGEDAESEKLPMDRVRQLITATEMSSSSVETPTDEAGPPAVEVEEEGGAGEPDTPGKPEKKKKPKRKHLKAERKRRRLESRATVNNIGDPIEQETEPVTSDPVDVPGGEVDGVLIEEANSSGEDSAVFVDIRKTVVCYRRVSRGYFIKCQLSEVVFQ